MTLAAEKLLEQALALPDEQREALVEVLLTSLPLHSQGDVEAAWRDELVLRLKRHEAGETVAVDWTEATRRIRAEHGFE